MLRQRRIVNKGYVDFLEDMNQNIIPDGFEGGFQEIFNVVSSLGS